MARMPELVRPMQWAGPVHVEPSPRRIRCVFAGETIADTRSALLLLEQGHLPVYYLPVENVRMDLLERSDRTTSCPRKGAATYYSVRVAERVAEDAVWRYEEPIDSCPDISGHVAIQWNAMDSWWEEDDEVFVHARDPYHRIDVLRSSRHVRVEIDGTTLAESRRPWLLFETGLPTRYYLPRADVRLDLLQPTATRSGCPYKGWAGYYSASTPRGTVEDIAWTYLTPIPECAKIEQAICFYDEQLDIYLDGELQQRPLTRWSPA